MTDSTGKDRLEAHSDRDKQSDGSIDYATISRQIRVCRSMLGAILDELESREISADTNEELADHTTAVTAEIESLWEALEKVTAPNTVV